jgi:hypothetical protein
MIAGTKADTVTAIIEKIPLKARNQVTEITLDMAANMDQLKNVFQMLRGLPTDSMFKISLEALQEIRIKYRWQAIDQENEAMEKAKEIKSLNPEVLSNGDTLKQLLARSRYLLYKTNLNGPKTK